MITVYTPQLQVLLTLERGNGFIVRSQTGGRHYWAEGRAGPYSASFPTPSTPGASP